MRVGVQPGTVRTAVCQDVAHPERPRDVVVMQRIGGDDSSYAAHGLSVEQSECHESPTKRAPFDAGMNGGEIDGTKGTNIYSAVGAPYAGTSSAREPDRPERWKCDEGRPYRFNR